MQGAIRKVEEARTLATGNVNPQLFLFGLLVELRRALGASGRTLGGDDERAPAPHPPDTASPPMGLGRAST